MGYIFETTYDKKALKTMARIVRKTVRKKHSRRVHILGWIVAVLGILMLLPLGEGNIVIDFRKIVTGLAVVVIAVTILFEDRLNGHFAFIFGKNHAQLFDKSHMVGCVDEFRTFIKEKTGKTIQQIK